MKNICLGTLLFLISISSLSQDLNFKSAKEKNANKQELFANEEKKTPIKEDLFDKFFSKELGDTIDIDITPNVSIRGVVINSVFTEDFDIISVSSISIKGVRLLVSRKHFNRGEDVYFGFVLCSNHRDGLKIERDPEIKKYFWIKKEMSEIIPD